MLNVGQCKWDRTRYEEIVDVLRTFLKETGFHSSKVSFVPVAAFTGVNLVELRSPEGDPLRAWYSGPTLVALLGTSDCFPSPLSYTNLLIF